MAPRQSVEPDAERAVRPSGVPMIDEQTCPYCCQVIPPDARKCGKCGEWVVRTSRGPAAALLRAVGVLWMALSALVALALWRVASVARARLLATYVDENFVAPRVIDPILGAVIFLVLLLGLTVGLALVVFAGRSPRRPRW